MIFTSITSLLSFGSLRGMKTSTAAYPPSSQRTLEQQPVVYPKLLAPTSYPTTSSPGASHSPSSSDTSSFLTISQHDDVIGLIEYEPKQYTIELQVFLLDTSMLMDDQSRRIFELTALNFIIDDIDQIDLSISAISGIKVVDQRLTWSRLVEGKSTTGVEVYFDADATVSGDVTRHQCERALQVLFGSKANKFRKAFNDALYGESTEELKSPTEFSLEPMRVPLGLAAIAAGCVSFVAILIMSVRYVNKKEMEEQKDLSKTSIAEDNDIAAHGQRSFPVQEVASQQNSAERWLQDDSSESDAVLTFDDNSFNASLVFCPSVEKEQKDLCSIFECDQSAIANMENETDSDGYETYEYSPIRHGAKAKLTDEDLHDFDNEMRRAEC
ncbi:hypothetical protein ACHAXR_003806 [Thalassiosira sp. AJA248-18]